MRNLMSFSDFINESGGSIWKDKWDKDDLILTFYYSIYGVRGLGIDEKELAENVIGSSITALKKQSSNFDHLRGIGGLNRPHKLETEIFNEYHDYSQSELKHLCLNIIL